MSTVRIGPLSELHFSGLKDILEPVQGPLKRYEDADLLNEFNKQKNTQISKHPSFQGLPEFIFIEVEKENLLLIKGYLDKIGYSLVPSQALLEGEDFLCPECDYQGTTPGLCPKHQVPLLDYSAWYAKKKEKKSGPLVARISIAVLVGLILWAAYTMYLDVKKNLADPCEYRPGGVKVCPAYRPESEH